MNHNTVLKYFLAVFLLLPFCLSAQNRVKDNSPYSRFGLGDLFNQDFAALRGMGGLSAAFQDIRQVNILNPASLSSLQVTSFEAGLTAKYANLDDGNITNEVWSGNLAYLSLGFTTKNQLNAILDKKKSPWSWGMNFSLVPFSTVNYAIEVAAPVVDTINSTNNFSGKGGTYRFLWGNGVRYKNFSFGVNLGYLFGNLENSQTISIDEESSYVIRTERESGVGGFVWNAGAQYRLYLQKPDEKEKNAGRAKSLVFGLYGNSTTNFETNSSLLEYRAHPRFPSDTIANLDRLIQKGKLPASFSLGILYHETNKLKLGANFSYTQWSNFEMESKPNEKLNNGYRVAIGGGYTPDFLSYNNYLRRVEYQLGAFFEQDPRLELKNFGFTLGGRFPIILPRQAASYINLALEAGKIGGIDGIEEWYSRLTVGFSLNDDTWFFQRKFN